MTFALPKQIIPLDICQGITLHIAGNLTWFLNKSKWAASPSPSFTFSNQVASSVVINKSLNKW
jgi:hypothetical protein